MLTPCRVCIQQTIHFTSNFSPFKPVYGFNPLTLLDLSLLPLSERVNVDRKRKAKLVKVLHEKAQANIERKKEQFVLKIFLFLNFCVPFICYLYIEKLIKCLVMILSPLLSSLFPSVKKID